MSDAITYQKAGVDPEKAGNILSNFASYLKSRPQDPNLIAGIGPFASCYQLKPLLNDLEDPILVTSCDGVGTKVKLALDWEDLTGLGKDLVGMNVNDVLCAGGKPVMFLDYYACGKLDDTQLTTLLKSIQEGCEDAGMVLAGGETAEMPGIYTGNHFDLAGFVIGLADRKNVLGPQKVKVGDRLLGIRSSGFHSNGYSLVRKIVEKEKLRPNDKPTFDSRTWKEILLAPTIIYVKPVLAQIQRLHAAAHLTGGGLFENLPRVLPKGVVAKIDSKAWDMPELYKWFQAKAGISTEQLLSTFNCGVGMIIILPESEVGTVKKDWEARGLQCAEIGRIEAGSANEASVLWQ